MARPGPHRISKETGLLKKWPANGPPKVYTAKGLGGGHGSPIVAAGKIYGAGKEGAKEFVWCLNEKDGSEVWKKDFATPGKVGYDEGPRAPRPFTSIRNSARWSTPSASAATSCA